MSSRRPDLTYEEAAAAAGIDDHVESMFEDSLVVQTTNDENKPLLGRRITIVIEREAQDFDAPMTTTVTEALLRYLGMVVSGGAGRNASEVFRFAKQQIEGELIEPVLLSVRAETYRIDEYSIDTAMNQFFKTEPEQS